MIKGTILVCFMLNFISTGLPNHPPYGGEHEINNEFRSSAVPELMGNVL